MTLIAPSILSANFSTLGAEVAALEKAGADWIHIDCFDGHFVPTLTIGMAVVADIRSHSTLPFDVHFMTENPEKYIAEAKEAGVTNMTVHVEAIENPHKIIQAIRKAGMNPGLAIRLETPVEAVFPYLNDLYQVLVMTVRGGYGGDPFQKGMVGKIEVLRGEIANLKGTQKPLIAVDGGITPENAPLLIKAGADVLCAGSSVFKHDDLTNNIAALR